MGGSKKEEMKRYSLQLGSDPPREDPDGTWVKVEDVAEVNVNLLQHMDEFITLARSMMDVIKSMADLIQSARKHGTH